MLLCFEVLPKNYFPLKTLFPCLGKSVYWAYSQVLVWIRISASNKMLISYIWFDMPISWVGCVTMCKKETQDRQIDTNRDTQRENLLTHVNWHTFVMSELFILWIVQITEPLSWGKKEKNTETYHVRDANCFLKSWPGF